MSTKGSKKVVAAVPTILTKPLFHLIPVPCNLPAVPSKSIPGLILTPTSLYNSLCLLSSASNSDKSAVIDTGVNPKTSTPDSPSGARLNLGVFIGAELKLLFKGV